MTTTPSTGTPASHVTHAVHAPQPVVITNARGAASAELSGRVKRYTLAMAFRMACFLAMLAVDGWLRWVLLAVAVFMPYLAVVLANQADQRSAAPLQAVAPSPATAITTGQALVDGPGDVITGEIIELSPEAADERSSFPVGRAA
jgi:hypothetical protein